MGTDCMTIQSSVQIGNVIRNAVVFNVKKWPGETMNSDSLLAAVERLFTLLETRKVDYVLIGGIALLYYVEGRNTEDLELIMASSSLGKLPEIKVTSRDIYFLRAAYGELQIAVLLTRNSLFEKVLRNYSVERSIGERNVSIATVEGLLLLKLYALPSLYRQGNFARVGIYENDIATLIYEYEPDISLLTNELSIHVSDSDLAEIKSIISDIQQRIERFQKGSN